MIALSHCASGPCRPTITNVDTFFCLVLRLRGGGYPQYILSKAARLNNDNETIENLFYPLYYKILFDWFPMESYDICPHWQRSFLGPVRTGEFPIAFVIEHNRRPLLLIDIKPPSDFQSDSSRSVAINEVLHFLDVIGPTNQHTDRLYAISAIGKKWRACYAFKGSGSEGGRAVRGVAKVNSLKSDKPECWNEDITSDESWAALQSIVETIKSYVA
jgi:hypothetical protein